MQLRIEQDRTLTDIHVLIRYAEQNRMLRRLVTTFESLGERIEARTDSQTVMLSVVDILYFESVDKRTFAYSQDQVYQVSDRLYQVKARLERLGFVQVSKACLLNINMLETIRSVGNSRMEAVLANGEKVSVSRRYIPEIKSAIQGRQEW